MKKRNRIWAVFAALTMLCACNKEEKPIETTSAAETTEAIPESTENSAAEATEILEEAVSETETEDFEIEEENGTLSITLYCGSGTDVTIPAEIGGKAVVRIGAGAFRENAEIERVTIPDGVLSIGEEAFFGCARLKEAVLPDSVASIENFAFMWCDQLENVVFPNRAVEMGRNIFSGNIIDAEHPAPCPWICKMREENPLVIVNGNLLDAMECDGEIVVPDGVLSICPSAFSEVGLNARPTSVRLPEGLKKIPDYLFMGLFDMVSVTIPESVTEIGEGAFDHCVSLSSLTLPDGVTSIGENAFAFFTDSCTVTYRGETYSSERYDELYALFAAE